MHKGTEEASKAIQEANTSNIAKTNLPIYTTAAAIRRKSCLGKNTKRIELNTPPWQMRIKMTIQELRRDLNRLTAAVNGMEIHDSTAMLTTRT